MEGYLEDGTFQATNFICHVTGISFGTKNEVLNYCGSGGLERAIEAKNTLDDKTTLQVISHQAYLSIYSTIEEREVRMAQGPGDHKWLLEIRAGGENGRIPRKMYKVYAHPSSKVRITSKAEVMRLIDEGKLPDESTNGDCNDTSNKDNIIAQLDFNVSSLPPGWVKETTFKKCSDGIRTDRYYTDPVTKKVFRSLKAAEQYFKYEKIMDCYKPTRSVTDLYSFDGCVHMPLWLARRLKMDGTKDQCEEECQTSCLGCSAIHFIASLCSVNDPLGQTPTIEEVKDGKEELHGDSKEKLDEEECHGDDKMEQDKEEALNGDGNEKEDNEEMPHGDGKEDEDEPGALRGSDKVGVNG
ncbi:unnamed protein product [Miscanthus lutarioriparius]|uniref:MBD domain-containing protein n=1 Tax=Miscanthus lutarioriparius TaxID=422564 RepID=A0A811QXG2_9POAL|nr:unnamed protein product [Miscanthus lutarioriparius]